MIISNKFFKSVFCLLLFVNSFAYSQNDSIYKEITSYHDTTSQLIGKARSLLILKFEKKDYREVAGIKDYLQKMENKNYISLYPIERWLLDYESADHNDILNTVLQFDSAYFVSFNSRIKPIYDILEKVLVDYSYDNQSKMYKQIDNSLISIEDKEFLKLNLNYILSVSKRPINYQDSLNNLADNFMSKFPHSNYNKYIEKNIRYEIALSDFGFGLNVGMGMRLNSGPLYNTIDEGLLIGCGIGVTYKKWDYDLHLLAGPVQLQKDLYVKGKLWSKGSDANYLNWDFSIARNLLNSKKHKLSPSIGLGMTEFSPYQDTINKYPYYKDIYVDIPNVILGINYQYKYPFRSHGSSNPAYQTNFGSINIRYALSWNLTNDKLYKGLVHYLTLAWGFEFYGLKEAK